MEKAEKIKRTSHLSILLRFVIAAAASWIILKDLDFAQLAQTFKRMNPMVLGVSILAYCAAQCLVGFRWWLVLRAQKIRIPLIWTVKLTFLGLFFSQFMPSSVGGDLVRAWYVSRWSERKLQAALGVVVDRIVGLISTFLLAFGSYLLFMRGSGILEIGRKAGSVHAWSVGSGILFPLVLSLAFITAGLTISLLSLKSFRNLFSVSYRHAIHFARQFTEVLKVYYHHPAVFAAGLVITIGLQSGVIFSYWGIGRDLGLTAAVSYYFVFFPMVWAFSSIPVSIAGIGILEGGVVFLFVKFTGADPEAAIALALCQRLTWLAASVPGVWFHLAGAHRKQHVIK